METRTMSRDADNRLQLGLVLKWMRLSHYPPLSQQRMADLMGIPRSTLATYENPEGAAKPRFAFVREAATRLGYEAEALTLEPDGTVLIDQAAFERKNSDDRDRASVPKARKGDGWGSRDVTDYGERYPALSIREITEAERLGDVAATLCVPEHLTAPSYAYLRVSGTLAQQARGRFNLGDCLVVDCIRTWAKPSRLILASTPHGRGLHEIVRDEESQEYVLRPFSSEEGPFDPIDAEYLEGVVVAIFQGSPRGWSRIEKDYDGIPSTPPT